ncbi:hypothetical protein BB559_000533 [Furculomyces boomerangus]|uniref:CHCH domain-containing protein n=1 Tax=Furculomyces boomerangus TaxID=61424 RepID=A0A2T9Z4Z7_9FUNG|nr:hypothetical protein BB559_000533 [Furculomyces boomerangus]
MDKNKDDKTLDDYIETLKSDEKSKYGSDSKEEIKETIYMENTVSITPRMPKVEANKIADQECAEVHYKFLKCLQNPPTWKQKFLLCSDLKQEYYECRKKQLALLGHQP